MSTSRRISLPKTPRFTTLLFVGAAVFVLALFSGLFVTIETGNVGVDRTLGKIDMKERPAGLSFKLPFITSVSEFSAKEITIDLNDLKPKAQDNLSLKDLDISVFYQVNADDIAEIAVRYANGSTQNNGIWYPAHTVVSREARRSVYETVAQLESLSLHREREQISISVQQRLQQLLDEDNEGVFRITRVVVRAITTDAGIEESIKDGDRESEAPRSQTDRGADRAKGCRDRDRARPRHRRGQPHHRRVVDSQLPAARAERGAPTLRRAGGQPHHRDSGEHDVIDVDDRSGSEPVAVTEKTPGSCPGVLLWPETELAQPRRRSLGTSGKGPVRLALCESSIQLRPGHG